MRVGQLGSLLLAAARSSRRASAGRRGAPRCRRTRLRRRRVRRSPRDSAMRTESASGSSICAPACAPCAASQRRAAPAAAPREATRRRRASSAAAHAAAAWPCTKPATSASRHLGRRGVAAALVLELAFLQAAVGDHDAVRHADQLPVGEHRARALAAVVEHHVDAGGLQLVVQRVGGRLAPSALRS